MWTRHIRIKGNKLHGWGEGRGNDESSINHKLMLLIFFHFFKCKDKANCGFRINDRSTRTLQMYITAVGLSFTIWQCVSISLEWGQSSAILVESSQMHLWAYNKHVTHFHEDYLQLGCLLLNGFFKIANLVENLNLRDLKFANEIRFFCSKMWIPHYTYSL